ARNTADAFDSSRGRPVQAGSLRRGAGVSTGSLCRYSPGEESYAAVHSARRILLLRQERSGHAGRWENVLGSSRRHRYSRSAELAASLYEYFFGQATDDDHGDLDQPERLTWHGAGRSRRGAASLLRRECPLEQYVQMYLQHGRRAVPGRKNVRGNAAAS